jgi:hypothetical protein
LFFIQLTDCTYFLWSPYELQIKFYSKDLKKHVKALRTDTVPVRQAARENNIPEKLFARE